jgi:hypothetical protein
LRAKPLAKGIAKQLTSDFLKIVRKLCLSKTYFPKKEVPIPTLHR